MILIGKAALQHARAHAERTGNGIKGQIGPCQVQGDLFADQTGHANSLPAIRYAPLRELDKRSKQCRIVPRQGTFGQLDRKTERVFCSIEGNRGAEQLTMLPDVGGPGPRKLEFRLPHHLRPQGRRQPGRKGAGNPVDQVILQDNARRQSPDKFRLARTRTDVALGKVHQTAMMCGDDVKRGSWRGGIAHGKHQRMHRTTVGQPTKAETDAFIVQKLCRLLEKMSKIVQGKEPGKGRPGGGKCDSRPAAYVFERQAVTCEI